MSDWSAKEQELLETCERGVQLALDAGADQAEVYAVYGREFEVSFEKNDLHQVSEVSETSFGVRVIRDHRLGFSNSNQPGDLSKASQEAVALAKASPPDAFNGLTHPLEVPETTGTLDPELMNPDTETWTRTAVDWVRSALAQDTRLTLDSGAMSRSSGATAIASSTGVRASGCTASAQAYLFGMAVDGDKIGSFAAEGDRLRRLDQLDAVLDDIRQRFAERALNALDTRKGESFEGPVVLTPETVQSFLVSNLLAALKADGVRKGQSPLASRVGESIAMDGFSLREEGAGLPGFPLLPFDREGMPRRALGLVEGGILRSFLYDAYEGRAIGRSSTGHAVGGPSSPPAVGASCLSLAPGSVDYQELLDVEKGVVVPRFAGTTNPVTGDFSGVVKGGMLIQRGEIVPVRETTIAGNLYTCLKDIDRISRERRTLYGTSILPAVRIQGVAVTAG
ncbi:MAG: TldD/PmbA family protein [Myxococcota bacterium]|jgi:PmbA protein|nr:TldD/PmbA family protein [Myxococcota bacterium]